MGVKCSCRYIVDNRLWELAGFSRIQSHVQALAPSTHRMRDYLDDVEILSEATIKNAVIVKLGSP
jgi:hypothetical protein